MSRHVALQDIDKEEYTAGHVVEVVEDGLVGTRLGFDVLEDHKGNAGADRQEATQQLEILAKVLLVDFALQILSEQLFLFN